MLNPKIDLVTANNEHDLREYVLKSIEFNRTFGYTLMDAQYQLATYPNRMMSEYFQYSVMLVYDKSHDPSKGPKVIESMPDAGQPFFGTSKFSEH